jgi:predicted N-acyltransferase
LKIKVHHSIADFSKEAWNELASGHSVYYSFEWCRAFEEEFSDKPLYVAAYEGERFVAVLPAFIVDDPGMHDYFNPRDLIFCKEFLLNARETFRRHPEEAKDELFSDFNKSYGLLPMALNRFFFPCLSVVSPSSYHGDILVARDVDWGAVVKMLYDEVYSLAKKHGVKCICCYWIPEPNAEYTCLVRGEGFVPVFGKPAFTMDVKFGSFDDYLSSLSADRRSMVKKEMRKCAESGVAIKKASGDDATRYHDRTVELLGMLLNKHGHHMSLEQIAARVDRIYESFGSGVETYFAFKAEEPVAVLLSFLKDSVHYPKYVGLDEPRLEGTYAYFSLAYYELIRECIAAGNIKQIHFGYASERAKMVRGCSCHDVYNYFKLTDHAFERDLKSFLVEYNAARKRYFDEMCAL